MSSQLDSASDWVQGGLGQLYFSENVSFIHLAQLLPTP